MSHRPRRAFIVKLVVLCLWAMCLVALAWYAHAQGIHLRRLPRVIRQDVLRAGHWGPLIIIGLYLASTVVLFFSKGILDIVSGAVYGPFVGSLIVIIGLNLSAIISFFFGRFFGRNFVQTHEKGWFKKYDDLLAKEGFITVLLMRLFLFPFDLVSIGCGMSKMSLRHYVLGTALGSLPGIVTFVVLGEAVTEPRAWALFGALLIGSLGIAIILRRSAWVKQQLLEAEPPTSE